MENHSLVLTSGREAEAKSTQITFCAKSLGRVCLKSPKSHLEIVSTVRGSGWVAVEMRIIASPIRYRGRY